MDNADSPHMHVSGPGDAIPPGAIPRGETTGRVTLGRAWGRRVRGLHVCKLAGSFRDMGRQHGALLRDLVPRGPIPYYRTYVEKMLRVAGLGALAPVVAAGIARGVGRQVARSLPPFVHQTLMGLAAGSGVPYARLLEGAVMPDSLMWVAARNMRLRGVGAAVEHRLALGLGCTSALAWGGATADGRLLHARNFDYHGVSVWPRTAAVLFHEPDEGLRYVSVAAAGVPLGGVTAMNEAGLTLTVHQHMFTDATRLGGVPIGVVGDKVMRKARDLRRARAILEAHRPIGCWTYVVGSGAERAVLCYEENPDRHAVVPVDPGATTFSYANIFLDPDLGRTERALYNSYWRANLARQRRAGAALEGRSGPLTPDHMAAILGLPGEDGCRIAHAVSMLLTVGSVVFRPEDGALWVARGEAPTANNVFVPFSLTAEDHAPELSELRGGVMPDGAEKDAFLLYRDSFSRYLDGEDPAGALELAERAAALQPDEPLYQLLCGLLALRTGRPHRALRALDRALALGHPDPERVTAFHLWRGRAADLLGRRAEALLHYNACLDRHRADPPVHRAARRHLRRPFTRAQARALDVEFAYVDVITP